MLGDKWKKEWETNHFDSEKTRISSPVHDYIIIMSWRELIIVMPMGPILFT